jgi:hypothetical protein
VLTNFSAIAGFVTTSTIFIVKVIAAIVVALLIIVGIIFIGAFMASIRRK